MNRKFSLLMPSYNQGRYITQAVASVLAQDDDDWELLILDNSSDDTPQRMAAFDDPRIRFQHIPQRMDPGSCLNRMLEEASGGYFAYIHTDNNLHPGFVRRLRQAMEPLGPLALAYCEQRDIDGDGRPLGVAQRGLFDLPRLLSLDSLGVPFAATTALARRLGGFSVDSYADDLVFSISAHGIADFVHVSAALVDYRLHDGSRTAASGGYRLQGRFAYDIALAAPALEARGVPVGAVLEQELLDRFARRDQTLDTLWARKLARLPRWWPGAARFEPFFEAGLFDAEGRPRRPGHAFGKARRAAGLSAWTAWRIGYRLHRRRKDFELLHQQMLAFLIPWACHRLGLSQPVRLAFHIATADSRTLWAARQLERELQWQPHLAPGLVLPPAYAVQAWPVAEIGPALDLREDHPPRLG